MTENSVPRAVLGGIKDGEAVRFVEVRTPGSPMDKFLSILEKAYPDKTLEERLGAVLSGTLAYDYEHSNRFGELGKAYEICAHVLGSADDKDVVDLLHKHFIEGKPA